MSRSNVTFLIWIMQLCRQVLLQICAVRRLCKLSVSSSDGNVAVASNLCDCSCTVLILETNIALYLHRCKSVITSHYCCSDLRRRKYDLLVLLIVRIQIGGVKISGEFLTLHMKITVIWYVRSCRPTDILSAFYQIVRCYNTDDLDVYTHPPRVRARDNHKTHTHCTYSNRHVFNTH